MLIVRKRLNCAIQILKKFFGCVVGLNFYPVYIIYFNLSGWKCEINLYLKISVNNYVMLT